MKNRCAFTLIEVLVVIAVIAILAAMLMPALKGALGARDETVALHNMQQVGIAFFNYAGDNDYALPPRATGGAESKWPSLLAKYLSDLRVYASSFDKHNWIIRNADPLGLATNTNNTSFIMNGYNDKGPPNDPNNSVQVRINTFASTVNTILLGTPISPNTQFYMDFLEGNGNEWDTLNLSVYNGGSNYLFADGSARFISQVDYVKPNPDNTSERYGDSLWLVDKTWQIPSPNQGGGN